MVTNLINNTFHAWTKIGLRSVVADALLRAYPNAQRPTAVQKKLIQALTYGYSVAVRGLPATGKSFAIAAWLLGLERAMREVTDKDGRKTRVPTTSALVLVPNVDLAIQYYYTLLNMMAHSDSEVVRSSPDAFVQLIFRKSNEAELDQLIKLQRYPHPHIIIAPPTIVLDILADKDESVRNLLDISNLKAIVLEEIDAAITKLQYFSKMKEKGRHAHHRWVNKQVPLQILLDYIIKRRSTDARKAGVEPEQPQLVFPTATLSTAQIKRFLVIWHNDWICSDERDSSNPRPFSLIQPGEEWKRRARSNSLLAVEDPPLSHENIISYVPDNLHHHIVTYDIRTGALGDAPVPKMETHDRKILVAQIESLKHAHQMGEFEFEAWQQDGEPNKFIGYPADIAIDALKKLLKHDNYPRNVIAVLGSEVDMQAFREKAAAVGINCKSLLAKKWNDDRVIGTLPIGRTDMLLDSETRKKFNADAEGGDEGQTTVWISNFFFCRGLDTPGIRHMYILHRMDKAREYITYAGRVARWPYATREDEIRDPRSIGKDRRSTGKVVSVILVRPPGRVGKHYESDIDMEKIVLLADGSAMEKCAWAEEAIRLAKLGCAIEPYFTVEQVAASTKGNVTQVKVDEKMKDKTSALVVGESMDLGGEFLASIWAEMDVDVEAEVDVEAGTEVEAGAEMEAEMAAEMAAEMKTEGEKEAKAKSKAKAELPAFLVEALGLLDEGAKPGDEVKSAKELGAEKDNK